MRPDLISRLLVAKANFRTLADGLKALRDIRHLGPHPQFSRYAEKEQAVLARIKVMAA